MIWKVQETGLLSRIEKVLPKGNAEIIFNLSDKIYGRKTGDAQFLTLSRCMINGINFSPFEILKQADHCFLGIQLNPFALKILFGIPVCEFNDEVIDGTMLCGQLKELTEKITNDQSFELQTDLILEWLRKKLAGTLCRKFDNRIAALCSDNELENFSAKKMSYQYNMSERQLRRITTDWLGQGPARYLLYKKYLKALQEIHKNKQSLTGIAYDCGFYDQSHLIREFRSFTGYAPGEYKKFMSHFPGHIFLPAI